MTIVTVYLPTPESIFGRTLAPGSAVVGFAEPRSDDRVLVYYEGNVYDSPHMRRYADRVFHAADRMLWNGGRGYPTVAKAGVDVDELVAIGTFDHPDGRLEIRPDARASLALWLGVEDLRGEITPR